MTISAAERTLFNLILLNNAILLICEGYIRSAEFQIRIFTEDGYVLTIKIYVHFLFFQDECTVSTTFYIINLMTSETMHRKPTVLFVIHPVLGT